MTVCTNIGKVQRTHVQLQN